MVILIIIACGFMLFGLIVSCVMLFIRNFAATCVLEGTGRFFYLAGLTGLYLTMIPSTTRIYQEFGLTPNILTLLVQSLSGLMVRHPILSILGIYVLAFFNVGVFIMFGFDARSRHLSKIFSGVVTSFLVLFFVLTIAGIAAPIYSMMQMVER